jgi:hypothetical protein
MHPTKEEAGAGGWRQGGKQEPRERGRGLARALQPGACFVRANRKKLTSRHGLGAAVPLHLAPLDRGVGARLPLARAARPPRLRGWRSVSRPTAIAVPAPRRQAAGTATATAGARGRDAEAERLTVSVRADAEKLGSAGERHGDRRQPDDPNLSHPLHGLHNSHSRRGSLPRQVPFVDGSKKRRAPPGASGTALLPARSVHHRPRPSGPGHK